MHIRKAKISEFTAIAELDRVAWLESFKGEFIPDGEHVWRIWVEFASTFVAVDEEQNIIGVSLAFPCNHGVYNIHKLFVAKEHQNKGIGTKLMRVLLEEIDELQVDSSLTVYPKNPSAIVLYTKLGFTEKRFEKDYYGKEEDRFVLTRRIKRENRMNYQITFYVPQEHCEAVKEAMFQAGAGEIDKYEACAWQILGEGQFRPMKGSNPFIGEQDKLEKVAEYKVEIFCVAEKLKAVIEALKQAHPYDVPAYRVVRLENI